ncbi:uncharacterized protein [Aristolochia californica]|uniref:uncharacterized protein isoform X2 n=1 Tax=Aristolochia californica TaxID=171875 RepID=UPI0035DC61F0
MDNLKRLVAVEQITLDNAVMESALDVIPNEHQSGNQAIASPEEVIICPAPLRPFGSPYLVDNLSRVYTSKSLPVQKGCAGLELLNCFWNKDDLEDDVDGGSSCKGFFCGSPPVRTNNPLVHDVHFVTQTFHFTASTSPLGTSMGRAERVPSCGASSFGGKSTPIVRIEGFSCGSSESHCFVPALA